MNNWFQKLLWNVAGAETPILEKCRTDHKKFSAIGATILMTAFIALCAGTSAAWYFTQKGTENSGLFGWSLAFGVLWATLIFCIDRSLVITLKKKENQKKNWWVVPFVSRAALAIIVAFMVSIPLELVIFEDYISANEENFEANQIAILGEKLKSNSGEDILNTQITNADSTLKLLNTQSQTLGSKIENLQKQINQLEAAKQNPQSQDYKNAKKRYDAAQKRYNDAAVNKRKASSQAQLKTYNKIMNNASNEMNEAKKAMNNAAASWRKAKQEEIDRLTLRLTELKAEKQQKDKHYTITFENQQNDKTRVQIAAEQRQKKEASKQEKLEKGNHFIRNFQILEYAVWQKDKNGNLTDKTQLLFLWLIRFLFFIIEILPTIVKIVSPLGPYERMVAAEEKNLIDYLNSDEYCDMIKNIHRLALSSQEDVQQQQHDAEVDLKKNILDKIKTAQLEVAQLAIEKWKEQELNKLKSTPITPPPFNGNTPGNSGTQLSI